MPPAASTLPFSPGALVLISDHINLQGSNPLVGPNDDSLGPRFPDMSEAYSARYRKIAREAASELGIRLHEGVYAALLGPSYETPAEIRYLRAIGADLVGMSTVAEVIAANHMGIRVLGHFLRDQHGGRHLRRERSTHEEVLETGGKVRETLTRLSEEPSSRNWRCEMDRTHRSRHSRAGKCACAVLRIQSGRGDRRPRRADLRGLQRRERNLRPDAVRREGGGVQGDIGGRAAVRRMVVAAGTETLTPPCGACRQILWEFCGDIELVLVNVQGKTESLRLQRSFPEALRCVLL